MRRRDPRPGWTLRAVAGPVPERDRRGRVVPAHGAGQRAHRPARRRPDRRPVPRRQRGGARLDRPGRLALRDARSTSRPPDRDERVDLVFDGLDTVATVALDGRRARAAPPTCTAPTGSTCATRCVDGANTLAVAFARRPDARRAREPARLGARPHVVPAAVQRDPQDGLQLRLGLGHRTCDRRHLAPGRLERWRTARLAAVRPLRRRSTGPTARSSVARRRRARGAERTGRSAVRGGAGRRR